MDPVTSVRRRDVLKLAGASVAAAAMPAIWTPVRASAPIKLGDIEVVTFSDGHLTLPLSMLAADVDASARAEVLKAAGHSGDSYRSPLNVTLIRAGEDVILVDAGAGPNFMSSAGKLAAAMTSAGVTPESVTKVIYTHAHPDHIWGTVNDFDELTFPNAACYVNEAEHAFWTADDVLTRLPEERHSFAAGAQRSLEAIKDVIVMTKPGQDVVTGVRIIDTPGHTPGHISVEVGNGSDTLVVLGDALTHPVISFAHPDWRPSTDQDPERAVATRQALLPRLAAEKSRIIGYHLPAPGLGVVRAKGAGYVFEAL